MYIWLTFHGMYVCVWNQKLAKCDFGNPTALFLAKIQSVKLLLLLLIPWKSGPIIDKTSLKTCRSSWNLNEIWFQTPEVLALEFVKLILKKPSKVVICRFWVLFCVKFKHILYLQNHLTEACRMTFEQNKLNYKSRKIKKVCL